MTNAVNLASAAGTGFFRNKIINGSFDVWQRGTSQSAAGYGSVDRWQFGLTSGTFTASKGQDVQPVSPAPIGNYLLVTGTSVVGGYMMQPIESVRTLAGQTVTLSYYSNRVSGSDTGSAPYLRQTFGTGGSASVDTTATSDTTSGYLRTLVFNLPSVAGKTIGAGDALSVVIPFAGTFSKAYWCVQLEVGSVATPFEQRPYGLEELLCKRYYQTVQLFPATSFANYTSYFGGSNAVSPPIPLPVSMRSTPTVSLSNSSVEYYSFAGAWTSTTLSASALGGSVIYAFCSSDGDGRGKLMRNGSSGTAANPVANLNAEL